MLRAPSGCAGSRTRVALYLRRSTDENQLESLETQRAGAERYCRVRGWVIVDTFVDDAVSRAEFKKRRGLIRMLNSAKDDKFDLVIARDETRIGGDIHRTGLVMQDLADHRVGLVYYFNDEIVSVDTAVDKFMIAARNFASELEREKISERTQEALEKKAKLGLVAGGISYGYCIENDRYVIDERQAETVKRIYELYAGGMGQRAIAKLLNDEGVPSPRAGKRGTGSWAPSSVRVILRNQRYMGCAKYNRITKVYRGGTKVREARPLDEHVVVPTPPIVSAELWTAVERRFTSNAGFGKSKVRTGPAPKYLLTGLSRCDRCNGPMVVYRWRIGQQNENVYICGYWHQRGSSVCSNGNRAPVRDADAAVIDAIKRLITPDIVRDVIRELRTILDERLRKAPQETEGLSREARKLKQEIARLAAALASTDVQPTAVIELIASKEARLRAVQAELATLESSLSTVDLELRRLEKEAARRLQNLHAEFDRSPEAAKTVLGAMLGGEKLRFVPKGGRYRVRGPIDVLFQDCFATPTGIEPVLPT